MCKWAQQSCGCRRSPKSLSSAQAASLCCAGIEKARKCFQGEHVVTCEMLSQYPQSAFQGFAGVGRGVPGGGVSSSLRPKPSASIARHRIIGCAKSWAFFSQKFLRFHDLRSVKFEKWIAGRSTPGLHRGYTDAKSTLN